MTLLSPVLSGVLNPSLKSGVASEQRYFTTFQGINSHHIQFPNITLPTDTEWKIKVVAAVPNDGAYLLADRINADDQSRFGLLNVTDGRVFGLTAGNANVGGDTLGLIGGNQLRLIEAVNNGGTILVTIDGTQVHSADDGTVAPVLNSVGRQYNGTTGVPPMLGVISLIQIEKAGTLVLDMPVNQNYTPTNNTVLDLSGQGNHGTFVGIEEGDSKLYTKDENGDWVSGGETLGGINN